MVSLSRSVLSNTGGARFFDDSSNMEDEEYLTSIVHKFGVYKPLKTTVPFSIHLLSTLSLQIASLFFAVYSNEKYKCREYFYILYAHVALWFLTLIVDQIARVRHYNLRLNGYLDFYRKTQVHHQIPIYVVSLCTAIILFMETIMQHFYSDQFIEKCVTKALLSPKSYLCAIITLELIVNGGFSIAYLRRVRKFNKEEPRPDVLKEEWVACSTSDSFAQGEIGYRQIGDKVYDFIEKQAEWIQHLRDHNLSLCSQLLTLHAQKQARSRTTAGN